MVFFWLLTLSVSGQKSTVVWQKTFGGSGDDAINAITSDADGTIYVLSTLQSATNNDLVISCLTPEGELTWKRTLSGNRDEYGVSILVDSHDEIVVLAASNSTSGFATVTKGYSDVVVLRYSKEGELINAHNYGGSFIDVPSDIIELHNGNYLVTASTRSLDGDVGLNFGQYDVWAFEIDYNGSMLWQKTFGGSDEDMAVKAIELENGDLMIAAQSSTYDGAFSDNAGDFDIVLFDLNANGDLNWHKSYGGFYSETAADLIQLPSGNIMVAGSTFSSSWDVIGNNGGSDIWLFEVDQTGAMVWGQNYGSNGNESAAALLPFENGFLLLGSTNSDYLQDDSNHGEQDFWLFEIDNSKTIINQSLFGASGFESGNAMHIQNDGSIILGGSTNSSDGLVQGNQGKSDGWLLNVRTNGNTEATEAILHPNPTRGVVYINQLGENSKVSVFGTGGNMVMQEDCENAFAKILDLSGLPAGVYIVSIESDRGIETHRIIKD